MAPVHARQGTPPLLADECVFDVNEMRAGAVAVDAVSIKLVECGSLLALRRVATVAKDDGGFLSSELGLGVAIDLAKLRCHART